MNSRTGTLDPGFVETFPKSIDCYVMGSRTYETALRFEAKGFGWSYGDKPTFVLTSRELPRTSATSPMGPRLRITQNAVVADPIGRLRK